VGNLLLGLDLLVLVSSHLRLICDVHLPAGPFSKKSPKRVAKRRQIQHSDVFQSQSCRAIFRPGLVVAAPRDVTASVCTAIQLWLWPPLSLLKL